MPRLAPITRPRTLFDRLAFWQTRREYGKVVTPLQVIYARKPRFGFVAQHIVHTMQNGLGLADDLRLLVCVLVSKINGCAFCEDLNLARAVQQEIGLERFQALDDPEASGLFTPRERAAFAYAREAAESRRASDATFDALREHFSDEEIVELTWAVAAETYFNVQSALLEIGSDSLLQTATPS